MKTLHIYPTARAIRVARDRWQDADALIPTLMRMDEFEMRCVRLGERALVDPLQRVLLLREAADFAEFEVFRVDRALVRFFTRSEGLFRFFEELSREEVDCDRLEEADAYAEFGRHLSILAQLKARYGALLEARGLTDTMFVPEVGAFHSGFVAQYDRIEIFLEGLLSRYELKLLSQVAEHTEMIVHYTTTPYSAKMEERLGALGVTLPRGAHAVFDLGGRRILDQTPAPTDITARVIAVSQRYEQIAEAFVQIQRMVDGGIAAERIALILPDESFKEAFRLYDKLNNLNFAMGFDYANGRSYKILEALARHWRLPDATTQERLERYGMSEETLDAVSASGRVDVEGFFAHIDRLELREKDPLRIARVAEAREEFVRLFPALKLAMSEWLHLWLQMLGSIRIDDLRGGLVTVMGV